MFLPADVTWSNRPTIVTFGAGACANAAGASNPTMATRHTTTANVRLIHRLLSCAALRERPCSKRHQQQLLECRQRDVFTARSPETSTKKGALSAIPAAY